MAVKYISKFSSLNFDKNWKTSFGKDICYTQKFALSDTIRFQMICDDQETIPQVIIRQYKDELQPLTEIRAIRSYELTKDLIIYDYIVSQPIREAGHYNVALTIMEEVIADCDFSVYAEGDEELENTLRISYTHDRNEFDTIFLALHNQEERLENLYFDFRVEGGVLPGEKNPLADTEHFRDQRYTEHQLSSLPYLTKTLTIGDRQGVPDWVGEKLNLIFSLSDIQINRKSYTRKEGSVPEINSISDLYPLFVYKLEIEGEDPYKHELEYEDPMKKLFILRLDIPSSNYKVRLPITTNRTDSLTINWGDGTTDKLNYSTGPEHTYVNAGLYNIIIKGEAESFTLPSSGSLYSAFQQTLITVENWGISFYPRSTSYMFIDCKKLKSLPENTEYNSIFNSTTSLNRAFCYCPVKEIPKGTFQYAKHVSDVQYMFAGCETLTTIPEDLFSGMTHLSNVRYCFNGCKELQGIPKGLFDNNTLLTSFENVFLSCKSISSIPDGLFDNCKNAVSFSGTFERCSSLTSIPADLFRHQASVTSFLNTFYGCSNINSIPADLFRHQASVTSFSNTFYGCNNINSIPETLFRYNLSVTSFSNTFNGCGITSIPNNLFFYNTNVLDFNQTFANTPITAIPENLFARNVNTTNITGVFYECTHLMAIPARLFYYNTAITSLENCFLGCSSISSIPESLFANNPNVIKFNGIFQKCTNLESIPANLFRYNTAVTSFQSAFASCTRLEGSTIPGNLFYYNTAVISFQSLFSKSGITTISNQIFANNPNVTNFTEVFGYCNFTTIPTNLFANNPNAVNFSLAFAENRTLTTIPNTVFAYNINVTDVSAAFYFCGITSIPNKLFKNNPLIINFSRLFSQCKEITTIPEDLFSYVDKEFTSFINVDNTFSYTTIKSIPENLLLPLGSRLNRVYNLFSGCSSLTSIPKALFDNNLYINTFTECFYSCINLTGDTPTTNGFELWERNPANGFPVTSNGYKCFYLCKNLSTYNQIPRNWAVGV